MRPFNFPCSSQRLFNSFTVINPSFALSQTFQQFSGSVAEPAKLLVKLRIVAVARGVSTLSKSVYNLVAIELSSYFR